LNKGLRGWRKLERDGGGDGDAGGEWGHNTKTPIPENLTSPPIPL